MDSDFPIERPSLEKEKIATIPPPTTDGVTAEANSQRIAI